MSAFDIRQGDVLDRLREMPDESVNCVVTSPPYWGLRNYGIPDSIWGGDTAHEHVWGEPISVNATNHTDKRRWGHTRNGRGEDQPNRMPILGLKPKDLVGVPWRVAFALQDDGWWLRQDIIWHKKAPMPESVRDRCTKAHEYIFLMTKSARYFYDHTAIMEPLTTDVRENYPARAKVTGRGTQGAADARGNDRDRSGGFPPSYKGSSFSRGKTAEAVEQTGAKVGTAPREEAVGRNKRSVWTLGTSPTPDAHFATFPLEIPETAILAGTSGEGRCSGCGAPLVRTVERTPMVIKKSGGGDAIGEEMGRTCTSGQMVSAPKSFTTGWLLSCRCNLPKEPCVVLDPFSGSGTTGLAALKHGRKYIGIELNPEYVAISHRRMDRHCPLLA